MPIKEACFERVQRVCENVKRRRERGVAVMGAEPRKILCQCALPSVEQLSVHPRSAHGGAGIPNRNLLSNVTVKEAEMAVM